MPFIDVTNVVMNEEAAELEKAYNSDPNVKEVIDQFNNECRLRCEPAEAQTQKTRPRERFSYRARTVR